MATAKIQGNPLGSGSVTLAAPNTNSDFTLNMPAANGTLLTNSGTEAAAFSTLAVAGNNVSNVNGNWRNRIINGDMVIDQRNNGGSSSAAASTYYLDRWLAVVSPNSRFNIQRNAGSVTPPAGFTNYLGITSTSAYSVASGDFQTLWQRIEGFNTADLGWGASGASPVTLSFWVRSSLTGTFGGAVQNSAVNRSYPFSYTISSANTWEYKTITIPGDTTGTWLTDNGVGITLSFGLGVGSTFSAAAGAWAAGNFISATGATSVVGTNGATFFLTGVQLEAGTVATPFERRDYGRELIMCQRYYWRPLPFPGVGAGQSAAQIARMRAATPVTMRASPTLTLAGQPSLYNGGNVGSMTGLLTNYSSPGAVEFDATASTSMTLYACVVVYNNYDSATVAASAEL